MIKHTSCNLTQVISDSKKNLLKIPSIYKTLTPSRLSFLKKQMSIFDSDAPYDLTEIYRAIDTEAFISATMRKKILLILKGGYSLVSEDERNKNYIKKRIAEMEFVSDIYFEDFLLELVSSLIYNHNAVIYLSRSKKSSTGLKVDGKEPIDSLHILPEYQVKVIEDIYKQVEAYKYETNEFISKEINKDNIIHLKIDKKPGVHYGTPPLESVRDDILSLRQIEESLERLIYKLTSPLIHMIVGTKEKPASIDRTTMRPETEIYNEKMQEMDDAGGITTSERVQIKMIGAESQALRLESPLKHYVSRVLMGLNISEVDLGLGNSTTSGAAEIISESLKSNIEMYQYLIENMISNHIFNSLILESSRYANKQYVPKEERVRFKFEKSDIQLKLKIESHLLQEVNAGVITKNEYRIATGRFEFTDEQLEEMIQDLNPEGDSSALLSQNVIAPTNQFADSLVSTKLDSYVNYLYKGHTEMATEVLYIDIKDTLDMPEVNEVLHKSISSLTTTLQKYIIDKVPQEILKKRLNSTLDNILTDLLKS